MCETVCNLKNEVERAVDTVRANRTVPGNENADHQEQRDNAGQVTKRYFRDLSVAILKMVSDLGTTAGHLACLRGHELDGWKVTDTAIKNLKCDTITLPVLMKHISVTGTVDRLVNTCSNSGEEKFIARAFLIAVHPDVKHASRDTS